jgi:hypothetical protein
LAEVLPLAKAVSVAEDVRGKKLELVKKSILSLNEDRHHFTCVSQNFVEVLSQQKFLML